MISHIFNLILYLPLLNLLVFVYHYIPDIGIVIILLTVLIRLLLLPSFHKTLKHQHKMNQLQPKLNEIKEKHKDNQQEQAKAMMDLYKEHKFNPLGSCLPIIIQAIIIFPLYWVFIKSLNGQALAGLYSFVSAPAKISPLFLGLIDLSKSNIPLALVAAILQFFQSKMLLPKTASTDTTTKMMSYQTLYLFPLLTLWIGYKLPAGLPLYWITTTLFGIAQQYYFLKKQQTYGQQQTGVSKT